MHEEACTVCSLTENFDYSLVQEPTLIRKVVV
jgi:hypothetical protein